MQIIARCQSITWPATGATALDERSFADLLNVSVDHLAGDWRDPDAAVDWSLLVEVSVDHLAGDWRDLR